MGVTILATAYKELKRSELAKSQYEFSARWLGKGRSYYSWLKSRQAEPSIEALTCLLVRMDRKIELLEADPDPWFPEVSAHDAVILRELRASLMKELHARCVPTQDAAFPNDALRPTSSPPCE